MTTNLPISQKEDSGSATKLFFDTYGLNPLEFGATDVSATLSFFQDAGFDEDAALVVSAVILKQAKLDNLPVFQLLDSLKVLDGLGLSTLVGEILNNNRIPTSTLGFRTTPVQTEKIRNIAA